MTQVTLCPECGRAIPADVPLQGLCPSCLIDKLLPLDVAQQRFEPPSTAALAAELPEFDIEELIGRGGMGAVYRARQIALNRTVAIKIFPRQAASDPIFGARFEQEAHLQAQLHHQGILAVHDFGQTAHYWFIVMEWVSGGNLRPWIQNRKLTPRITRTLGLQLCEAVEYAHKQGVIHRDLKPENILVRGDIDQADSRVFIADFGLAKLAGNLGGEPALTRMGEVMGTPYYMSPEQRERPAEVDMRADIFALGVLFHEMLTSELPAGKLALRGMTSRESARWDALLTKCLKHAPQDRFQSVVELRQSLMDLERPAFLSPKKVAAVALAGLIAVAGFAWSPWSRREPVPTSVGDTPQPTSKSPVVSPDITITAAAANDNHPPQETSPLPTDPGAPVEPLVGHSRRIGPGGATLPRNGPKMLTLYLNNLPSGYGGYVMDRMKTLTQASQTRLTTSGSNISLQLDPVPDLDAFAKSFDLGTVRRIDPAHWTIEVDIDPSKLPTTLKPAVTDRNDPTFYSRNLEDMDAWDRTRRRDSIVRLKNAEPTQLREQIAEALARIMSDGEVSLRREAAAALAVWSTPAQVPVLVDGLSHDDRGVRENAEEALKKVGPAAELPVLARLDDVNRSIRLAATHILGAIGTSASLPRLEAMISDPDRTLSKAASDALNLVRQRVNAQHGS